MTSSLKRQAVTQQIQAIWQEYDQALALAHAYRDAGDIERYAWCARAATIRREARLSSLAARVAERPDAQA